MTRLFALLFVVSAFTFTACEKHPLQNQELVTETHGSNGGPGGTHGKNHANPEGAAKGAKEEKGAPHSEAKH